MCSCHNACSPTRTKPAGWVASGDTKVLPSSMTSWKNASTSTASTIAAARAESLKPGRAGRPGAVRAGAGRVLEVGRCDLRSAKETSGVGGESRDHSRRSISPTMRSARAAQS